MSMPAARSAASAACGGVDPRARPRPARPLADHPPRHTAGLDVADNLASGADAVDPESPIKSTDAATSEA